MTDRKMTDEEVFVSAMNAAITGLMASHGVAIFDLAAADMREDCRLNLARDLIDEVVTIASIAGKFALEQKEKFDTSGQD